MGIRLSESEVKTAVYKYIRENDGVSYAELEHVFESLGYNYKGDTVSCSDMSYYVVFWCNWSERAFKILGDLVREKKIERIPTERLTYFLDGKVLNLPTLTTAAGYKRLKRDYWLPCVFTAL